MLTGKIVYFDVETRLSSDDVGGWAPEQIRKMRISVAVSYTTEKNQGLDPVSRWNVYNEKNIYALLKDLRSANLVVGFNIRRFDYEVLSRYTNFNLRKLPTFDMLEKIESQLGHRLSMESLAQANFGKGKSGDGLEAVRMWNEGKVDELKEYCQHDVELERELFMKGCTEGIIHYHGRTPSVPGRDIVKWMSVDWGKEAKEYFE